MKSCSIFLTFVLAIGISGCSASGPDGVVLAHLKAIKKGDLEIAYGYLSSRDQKVKPLEEYLKDSGGDFAGLRKSVLEKTTYRIKEVSTEGDHAQVLVEVTAPDFSQVMGELLSGAMRSALGSDKQKEAAADELAKKYEGKDLPTKTQEVTHVAIKEESGWKVYLGWDVKALLDEAKKLKGKKDLTGATTKYQEALTSYVGGVAVGMSKAELETEITNIKEITAYLEKVVLKRIRIRRQREYGIGSPEPVIFGTVINEGDRTLNEVTITVYFLDKDGKRVAEKDYHPVLVSKYSFGDNNKPLKPGYNRDFGYKVKRYAPSVWAGKVETKITEITFAEPSD